MDFLLAVLLQSKHNTQAQFCFSTSTSSTHIALHVKYTCPFAWSPQMRGLLQVRDGAGPDEPGPPGREPDLLRAAIQEENENRPLVS